MKSLVSYLKMVWDIMANEYYLQEHKTSRNFDTIIQSHLPRIVPRLRPDGLYLDLGGGRGRLKELYGGVGLNVVVGDISLAMMRTRINSSPSTLYIQMDAFRIPFGESVFDGVFSLLGDPYSLREAFEEVHRVLKPSGFFFIALPTKLWADNLRPFLGVQTNLAVFRTQNAKSVKVPSFLYDSKDLKKILLSVGFEQVKTGDWQPSGLISKDEFSRDVLISASNLGIPPEELSLITYALAHKSDVIGANCNERE